MLHNIAYIFCEAQMFPWPLALLALLIAVAVCVLAAVAIRVSGSHPWDDDAGGSS